MSEIIDKRVLDRKACQKDCDILHKIDEILHAFPDGIHNHREAHVAWIESKRAEKEFYTTLKKEIMTKGIAGVFSLLIIVLGLAVTGVLSKLGLPN